MNRLKPEKQIMVLSLLVEGNSIRSTERVTGVHRDTIMRLAVRTGKACGHFMDETMRDLECKRLELDEIWTFVVAGNKMDIVAGIKLDTSVGIGRLGQG